MRIFLLLWISIIVLYAADATIEVIKQVDTLPKLSVVDKSKSVSAINQKFKKLLLADMKVLSHFNVEEDSEENLHSMSSSGFMLSYLLEENYSGGIDAKVTFSNQDSRDTLFSKSYKVGDRSHFVFLIHEIAIDVNEAYGGSTVEWMKEYVIFSRYTSAKNSQIYISDFTLNYQKPIVTGGLNIFPKWASKNQDAIYYTHYDEIPALYKLHLKSGKKERILSSEGMIVCSDVSSDGRYLLVTMSPKGQPDVYRYDTLNKTLTRLTTYPGVDVNAQFIENEERIVFVSDRLGYPNIFAKNIFSNGVEQLVYYGRSNNSASAHGNYVVYTARESDNAFAPNSFNIHLISTKTDFIRRLSAVGKNQFPRFSDDGESVIFIKHYGRESSVGIVRLSYNKSFLFPLKGGKIQSLDW